MFCFLLDNVLFVLLGIRYSIPFLLFSSFQWHISIDSWHRSLSNSHEICSFWLTLVYLKRFSVDLLGGNFFSQDYV